MTESIIELQKFAEGLKEVFTNFAKNKHDGITTICMDYACKIIDLHLQLKEVEVDQELVDMEKSYNNKGKV